MAKSSKSPAPSAPSPAPSAPDYRQLRDELDEVKAELQREDLDVDKALKYYKRGLELVRKLEKRLDGAENEIQDIKGKFDVK